MKIFLPFLFLICLACDQRETDQASQAGSASQAANTNLVGTWKSDENDQATQKALGKATMTFTKDGKLIYDIFEGGKQLRIDMVYRVQGDTIISDQPSHPGEEKTAYKIENGNKLVMTFEGERTVFNRQAR